VRRCVYWRRVCVGILVGAVLAFCTDLLSAAEADPAAAKATEVFDSVYGADLKRARATRDTADNLELATRLLTAAKEATAQPEFLTVLCEKAFDLTSGYPDGYATAMQAMETLATALPAKVTWCTEQVVDLLQKRFAAARGDDRTKAGEELVVALLALADLKVNAGGPTEAAALLRRAEQVARAVKSHRVAEIDERQKALASSLRAAREVKSLKALIARNPQNASAREKLVRLYLVDMDNPAEAARYVEGVTDASLRKYVPAAAKGPESAPELASKELGDWYRTLADTAPTAAKAPMLARAKVYYERFLVLHTAEDLDRTAATLILKKLEASLDELGGAPMDAGLGSALAPKTLSLRLAKNIDMKFVLIPAGRFLMGAPDSDTRAAADERPQHMVTITKPFYMGVTEVTQRQWAAVMGDELWTEWPKLRRGADLPITNMRCWGADKFCEKMSEKVGRTVRLPTEAEWEYACRAGSQGRYCFGNSGPLPLYAWHRDNSAGELHEVGRTRPNAWGLYDMHGNASECCSDLYGERYYGSTPSKKDPAGPNRPPATEEAPFRVSRGGHFRSSPAECRCSKRDKVKAGWPQPWVGFRVVVPSRRPKMPPAGAATTPTAKPAAGVIKPGKWQDLLPLVDTAKHAFKGTWQREDNSLTAQPAEMGRVMIPVIPAGDYDLHCEFVRDSSWGGGVLASAGRAIGRGAMSLGVWRDVRLPEIGGREGAEGRSRGRLLRRKSLAGEDGTALQRGRRRSLRGQDGVRCRTAERQAAPRLVRAAVGPLLGAALGSSATGRVRPW
jgi:formylglycine-generating enzyme required for sulfatase activity